MSEEDQEHDAAQCGYHQVFELPRSGWKSLSPRPKSGTVTTAARKSLQPFLQDSLLRFSIMSGCRPPHSTSLSTSWFPTNYLSEMFADLSAAPLNVGTLANFIRRGGAKAVGTMTPVREASVRAEVAHTDE